MSETHQYTETDDERAARLPCVMKRYAKDIDKHGKPMDSGLADVLRFAAERLAERDALEAACELNDAGWIARESELLAENLALRTELERIDK
jgi:hypothetical protein